MSNAQQTASKSACIGMLGGLLLLGFAGTLVLTPSSRFEGELRRLQSVVVGNTTYNNSFEASAAETSSSGSSFKSSGSLASSSSGSIGDSSASLYKSSGAATSGILSLAGWLTGSIWGQLLVWFCFAFIYNKKAVAPVLEDMGTLADKEIVIDEDEQEDDFENGIFGCFDNKWVCLHGFFCPVVRQAQTNAVAGVCGFWETVLCWACCAMWSANLGPCCLMVMWRKQIKEVMGVEDHIMNDICCTLFCPLLSLCQMGAAVDEKSGYETTGCCTLVKV
jgi:Cys-rich protein (TIGR01571 family)